MKINTNLQSLIVQNNLSKSTNSLNQAIERLTTGYKINNASDNAANYSIVQDMTSKLNSYFVAQDNTSMGLDMLSTANESLNLISKQLTRIRDLAEQAANGTYGTESLEAIQSEVDARMSEINRIMSNSEYNGINFFESETPSKFLNVVTRLTEEEAVAQGYTIIKTAEELAAIGDGKYILMNDIDLGEVEDWTPISLFSGTLNGNGYEIKNLNSTNGGLFSTIIEDGVIENVGLTNVNIHTNNAWTGGIANDAFSNDARIENCYVTGNIKNEETDMHAFTGGLIGNASSITIENCYVDILLETDGGYAGGFVGLNAYNGATILNSYATGTMVVRGIGGGLIGRSQDNESSLAMYSSYSDMYMYDDGPGVILGGLIGHFDGFYDMNDCYWDREKSWCTQICYNWPDGSYLEDYNIHSVSTAELEEMKANRDVPTLPTVQNDSSYTFQVGISGDDSSRISVDFGFGIDLNINVLTNVSALSALENIDNIMNQISAKQTTLGAAQNRLTSSLDSIGVNIENLTSSRSTLRDADIAKVSSDYIRQQILQQASATLLATANQSPALVLQLIQGF